MDIKEKVHQNTMNKIDKFFIQLFDEQWDKYNSDKNEAFQVDIKVGVLHGA